MQESFRLILSAWETQYPNRGARDIMSLVWSFLGPGFSPPQWRQIIPTAGVYPKVYYSKQFFMVAVDADGWWWSFTCTDSREDFILRANAEEPVWFPEWIHLSTPGACGYRPRLIQLTT